MTRGESYYRAKRFRSRSRMPCHCHIRTNHLIPLSVAALKMKVEDLRPKGAGWQLHEKGGKEYPMPCHHALAEALRLCIDAAGIDEERKGFLFRTSPGDNGTILTEQPMDQSAAWLMIRRRA